MKTIVAMLCLVVAVGSAHAETPPLAVTTNLTILVTGEVSKPGTYPAVTPDFSTTG